MKKILGLDIGTNSIGWAVITMDEQGNVIEKAKLGSRIIPMTQDVLGKFDSGITESQTAERTRYRSMRRLNERCLKRRERLFRVLHTMGFLPAHFDQALGWNRKDNKTYGKFLHIDEEPKIAWERNKDGKMQFVFMDSFEEMLADFREHSTLDLNDKKIPLDWTLYYLRHKALTRKVSKEELAWLMMSFNQKRGYYQLRGEEEEEDVTKRVEFVETTVDRVEDTGRKEKGNTWYDVHLAIGKIYRRASKTPLFDLKGKKIELILTTEFEKDGVTPKKDKEGNEKYSIRVPKEDDWTLRKKRTEKSIENSGKHVGTFIYEQLRRERDTKIRGNFVHTIERKYYKNELRAILQKQMEFHPELKDATVLKACIEELYPKNEAHRKSLENKDMVYFLLDDLIFYQRPLKSKKGLIDNCPYEKRWNTNKETGEIREYPIKCIAKSNPYYQEFRLHQFISNLRFIDRETDAEVTQTLLPTAEDYVRLFDFLNDRKDIHQDILLKEFFGLKKPKGKEAVYPIRWNYAEEKEKTYPCNETRHELLKALKKAGLTADHMDSREKEYALWHLLYSVENKGEIEEALRKKNLGEAFVQAFANVKPFKKDYGAFSEKAIKKMLPLMRRGSRWSLDAIDSPTRQRMDDYLAGKFDEKLYEKMRSDRHPLTKIEDFQALPTWLAGYVVYGRHSEAKDIEKWATPDALKSYIRDFKQHSMRNPIVEQVVLETLRTVHAIWEEHGQIDEIHVEMGREMKNTAEKRKQMSEAIARNEATNLRIKNLLIELQNQNYAEVRAYSPSQQDILRIYEEGALASLKQDDTEYEEITKISKLAQPSASEMKRYILWLEQRYKSPYTGRMIPLSRLFTTDYEIEHVIPRSRFFDDSMSNKVICEAEVNKRKGSMLAYEYIKKHGGEIVETTHSGRLNVLKIEEYEHFVAEHYKNLPSKRKKLLMEDIPNDFIQRQLNDTRYISRFVKNLLSNVVREEGEEDATSKHVIVCTGGVTERLKKDWGLNDVWNHIISPRFERLNQLTKSDAFGTWENKEGKRVFQTKMPIELQKGFQKKRIDHRHHAMDALVIACASRNIVNYLNNESAGDAKKREDLKRLLCVEKGAIRKPWETFTQDAEEALRNIVVSFKNYIRVINKATNYYEHYNEEGKKQLIPQKGQTQWGIRKPLHKETVFGRVNLRRKETVPLAKALKCVKSIVDKDLRQHILGLIERHYTEKQLQVYFKNIQYKFNDKDVSKVEVWVFSDDKEPMVATRKAVDDSFTEKTIAQITDTGIQKILLNFLASKGGDSKLAFSSEGLMELNENIAQFNDGKPHKPIKKVRLSEPLGLKNSIGETGAKQKKFVVAQKGTNLYFAIYENEEGKRTYETIPLNVVIARLKQGLGPVPEKNENGESLKFYISPNDLVYVPTTEEQQTHVLIHQLKKEQIYKMVSSSENRATFVPLSIAKVIYDKIELESRNKMERSIDLSNPSTVCPIIKTICWKLEVDRLGNITKIIR